jgi:hypothetical protein
MLEVYISKRMKYSEAVKELSKTWPTLENAEAEYVLCILTPGQSIFVPKGRVVGIQCMGSSELHTDDAHFNLRKEATDKMKEDDKKDLDNNPAYWITWNWSLANNQKWWKKFF